MDQIIWGFMTFSIVFQPFLASEGQVWEWTRRLRDNEMEFPTEWEESQTGIQTFNLCIMSLKY